MKTGFLFLTVLFSALFLGAQPRTYRILGTIDRPVAEEWIYMDKYMGNGNDLDSARIVDNRFEFTGTAFVPELCCLFFDPGRRETRRYGMARVFNEPGNTEVFLCLKDMFRGSEVKGGPVNREYFDKDKYLTVRFYQPMDSLTRLRATASQEDRERLGAEIEAVRQALVQSNLTYIKANLGSPAALAIFSTICSSVPLPEREQMLEGFHDDLKQCNVYRAMAASLQPEVR